MAQKKYVRTVAGERVSQGDFQALSDSIESAVGQVGEGFLVHRDSYIISGFTPSYTGSTVTVTRDATIYGGTNVAEGRALLAFRDTRVGTITYGHVTAGDPAKRSIGTSGLSGTFGLYIRFSLRETDSTSRVLWNADSVSGGPIEVIRDVATRYSASWDIILAETSPSLEWLRIAEVVIAGGAVSSLVDQRPLFFEGRPDLNYDPTQDWGSTDDRQTNRAEYPIIDLRTAIRALQTQIASITGLDWFADVSYSLPTKLNRDGSNEVTGHILPDNDEQRNLGSSLKAYLSGYFTNLYSKTGITLGSVLDNTVTNAARLYTQALKTATGSGIPRITQWFGSGTTSLGGVRLYTGHSASVTPGAFAELTFNALYDETSNLWFNSSLTTRSMRFSFGQDGIRVFRRYNTGGVPIYWTETEWTQIFTLDYTAGVNILGTLVASSSITTAGLVASGPVTAPSVTSSGTTSAYDLVATNTVTAAHSLTTYDASATSFAYAPARRFYRWSDIGSVISNAGAASAWTFIHAAESSEMAAALYTDGSVGSQSCDLYIPIDVPNGATITRVQITYRNAFADVNIQTSWGLYRREELTGTFTAYGISSVSLHTATLTTVNLDVTTTPLDTFSHRYYVRVAFSSVYSNTGSFYVYALQARFDMSDVAP